jgi:hypothetical protein
MDDLDFSALKRPRRHEKDEKKEIILEDERLLGLL